MYVFAHTLADRANVMQIWSSKFTTYLHLSQTLVNPFFRPVSAVGCMYRVTVQKNVWFGAVNMYSRSENACASFKCLQYERNQYCRYCSNLLVDLNPQRDPFFNHVLLTRIKTAYKTLFTWSGGPRSSGVGFFCFVSPRA